MIQDDINAYLLGAAHPRPMQQVVIQKGKAFGTFSWACRSPARPVMFHLFSDLNGCPLSPLDTFAMVLLYNSAKKKRTALVLPPSSSQLYYCKQLQNTTMPNDNYSGNIPSYEVSVVLTSHTYPLAVGHTSVRLSCLSSGPVGPLENSAVADMPRISCCLGSELGYCSSPH